MKDQNHKYIYPVSPTANQDNQGHIIYDTGVTLCGLTKEDIEKKSSIDASTSRKRYIDGIVICPECETKFRQILANQSTLIEAWA